MLSAASISECGAGGLHFLRNALMHSARSAPRLIVQYTRYPGTIYTSRELMSSLIGTSTGYIVPGTLLAHCFFIAQFVNLEYDEDHRQPAAQY